MGSKVIYEASWDQLYQEGIDFLTMISKLVKTGPILSESGIETYNYHDCVLKVHYAGEKNQIMASGQDEKVKELEQGLVKRLKLAEVWKD